MLDPVDIVEFRFNLFARDFDRSLAFYRDVLGLVPARAWDRPDGRGALLSVGGTAAVIEIIGAARGHSYEGPAPGGATTIAMRLSGSAALDAEYARLSAAGVSGGPPVDHPWGHRSFSIQDPDGQRIHLYCHLSS